MKLARLIACGAAALACTTAHAGLIDFQDLPSGSCAYLGAGVVQSGGFAFSGNPADSRLFTCEAGVLQQNATPALINANQRSVLTMAPAAGGLFSLDSFFAGGRTEDFDLQQPVTAYGVAEGIEVRGNLAGGGTVLTTFTLDTVAPYDWQQFFLPGEFTGLTSVVFTALGRNNPEFLIDDIAVSTRVAAVPEPGTAALLGIAALFGGGLRRRLRIRTTPLAGRTTSSAARRVTRLRRS
jgi:hypothetical protein